MPPAESMPDGLADSPAGQRKTIVTVDQWHCRWPIGDPQHSGFHLCGAETADSAIYCAAHMKVAYVPANKRVRVTWRIE